MDDPRIPQSSLRGLWSRTLHLSLRTQPWRLRSISNLVPAVLSRNAIFGPMSEQFFAWWKAKLERARHSRGEGGPPNRMQATAGKPARDFATVYYVYILQSKSAPNQRYIGLTRDLKKRLLDH